jgi:thymidine kinase
MIDGSAGSGKSTGFSYFLNEILKLDGYTVVASSHLDNRAESLGKTLGIKHVTIDAILDKIIIRKNTSDSKKIEKYNEKSNKIQLSSDFEINTSLPEELKTIFGEDLSKTVLFIDEITLLHSGKLSVLSEFAQKTGLTLIALGDSKQESASFDEHPRGLEDFIFVKAPKLQASLRITNKSKKKNRLTVENILNAIEEEYTMYPGMGPTELDGYIDELILQKSSELLTLSYTINPNGLFGEMYSSRPDEQVDFLLKSADENNKIGIIIDSSTKNKYSK